MARHHQLVEELVRGQRHEPGEIVVLKASDRFATGWSGRDPIIQLPKGVKAKILTNDEGEEKPYKVQLDHPHEAGKKIVTLIRQDDIETEVHSE